MDLTEYLKKKDSEKVPIADVEAVESESPSIDQHNEDKSNKIYDQFSPNSQVVSKESMVPIDYAAIRKTASELTPRTSTADLLLGLIPMATSALAGGSGEGVDVAAGYYTDLGKEEKKRQQTLEEKLLELAKTKAKSSISGGGRLQPITYTDKETNEGRLGTFDKSTGEYRDASGNLLNQEDLTRHYAVNPTEFDRRLTGKTKTSKELKDYTPRVDPETGLISRIQGGDIVPVSSQKNKLTPKQEKDLDNQISKFLTTDVFKKNSASIQATSTIEGLLRDATSGNATAANIARSELAKIAEGGGRLTDQDVERVGGPQDFRSKIARFKNLQKTGAPLLPSDIASMRQVARTIEAAARMKLSEAVMGMEKAIEQKGGVKGTVKTAMKPYLTSKKATESARVFPLKLYKQGKQVTVKNDKEFQEAISEGWN